jgi:hypothetical protein
MRERAGEIRKDVTTDAVRTVAFIGHRRRR